MRRTPCSIANRFASTPFAGRGGGLLGSTIGGGSGLSVLLSGLKHSVGGSIGDLTAVVTVSDDGPGIAPDYRERIFKLFETLAAPDGNGGTGMGLAIVKRLVEKYQGRISLKVADERCGCTFEFTWPRTLAASEHAA